MQKYDVTKIFRENTPKVHSLDQNECSHDLNVHILDTIEPSFELNAQKISKSDNIDQQLPGVPIP